MRKTTVLMGLLCLFIYNIPSSTHATPTEKNKSVHLKGRVTDAQSGKPLAGVNIYFPSLKTGTTTDDQGLYYVDNLPDVRLLLQISLIGHRTFTEQIDLSTTSSFDIALRESVTEINTVVITGQYHHSERKRTPIPITVVPRLQLLQGQSTNIIDALSNVPGVSQVTTGPAIAKPVIRGLGYNRVIVMNNGVRQEGQQWGDEHGVEIDEYEVDHVEILKGPASLAYGSDALAGAINMLGALSPPKGTTRAYILVNYQTNNGLKGNTANISANSNGIVWNIRGSSKQAHAYKNRYDGYVYNSGFRETAAGGMLGINRHWGYSHLHLGIYQIKPGIITGKRDEETGQFIKGAGHHHDHDEEHDHDHDHGEEHEIATLSDFKSYKPDVPFQKIQHYRAVWDNNLFIGAGNLNATLGFQQNRRQEFEEKDHPSLFFVLNTFTWHLAYAFPEVAGWTFTSGVNGMGQYSRNKGTEFLIPEYALFDVGVFAIADKNVGNLNLKAGLRYDHRKLHSKALYIDEEGHVAPGPDAYVTTRFAAFNKSLGGLSASLGITTMISRTLHTRLNIAGGYRAPNIAELASNGSHGGTFRYEVGNPDLGPETSLQADWSLDFDADYISAGISLFNNNVDNYIFSHKLSTETGTDSITDGHAVFRFTQGKAHLYGGEIYLDIHPHLWGWLHIENTFSYVRGKLRGQPPSMSNLPMIPPPQWTSEIKADIGRVARFMENAYFKIGINHNMAQKHYFEAYDTERHTPSFTLLNAGIGTDFTINGKTLCSLYIMAHNLTDKAYQHHLSRLKYAETNNATGRQGIFNMGRNVSFTLKIPVF